MKELKPKILNIRFIAISAVLLIAFAVLLSIIPYSGDDWAWGTKVGIERLKNGFAGYNGRYFGNLLVLVLTRTVVLRNIFTALSYVLLCVFSYFFMKSKSAVSIVFSALMIVFMPKTMFTEVFAWTSGFSNYVPPLMLELAYFYIIRNVFGDKMPEYKKYVVYLCAALGFTSSLFMESNTIFNILISALLMIYCNETFFEPLNVNKAFFGGSLLGAVFMFTNSAYRNVANNTDGYRSTAHGIKDLVKMVFSHLRMVSEELIYKNTVLCAVLAVIVIALGVWYLRKNSIRKAKKILIAGDLAALFVSEVFCAVAGARFLKNTEALEGREKLIYSAVILFAAAVFYLSLTLALIVLINDKAKRRRVVFFMISTVLLCAPLLIVDPIGARCIFAPRFFMVIVLCEVVDYTAKQVKPTKVAKRTVFLGAVAYILAGIIMLFSVYIPVHNIEKEREYYRELQNQVGQQNIYIKRADEKRLRMPNPESKDATYNYKLFYGLDVGAKLEVLDNEEYLLFKREFDRANAESGVELQEK